MSTAVEVQVQEVRGQQVPPEDAPDTGCHCCKQTAPDRARSAWNFFICDVAASIMLLFFMDTYGAIGCAVAIMGGSIPVCCCVNAHGWMSYIVFRLASISLFAVDILWNRSYGAAFGIVMGTIGIYLAAFSLRFMSPTKHIVTEGTPVDDHGAVHIGTIPPVCFVNDFPVDIPVCIEHAQPVSHSFSMDAVPFRSVCEGSQPVAPPS